MQTTIKTGKILIDTLQGHKHDRVPFWFMRQAGRYLPEYRELRAKKGGFLAMALDPASACEITMQPIRRFGMDGAIIFSDILMIPYALGQHLEFVHGEGPKLEPIDIGNFQNTLGFKNFDAALAPVYEALRQTRATLTAENFSNTALIGFAGAPWTVATYMIHGGGGHDFETAKLLSLTRPAEFSALMDMLVDATSAYLIAQIKAGAEAVQIFDSWAGALDAPGFTRWVIAPTRAIVKNIRAAYPHVPVIGFPRLAGAHYGDYARETGITAIGLDHTVPTKWAARTLQTLMPVQGNLDPVTLLAGGDALMLAAEAILQDLSAGPHVFNLGHGVIKETPVAHVEALVKILRG